MAGYKQRERQQKTLDRLILQYEQILDTPSPQLDRIAAEIGRLKSQIGV